MAKRILIVDENIRPETPGNSRSDELTNTLGGTKMKSRFLLFLPILMAMGLFLLSCAEENKTEQPVAGTISDDKAVKPVKTVDVEAEKRAILGVFNAHSTAVNANRNKGSKKLDNIFKYWVRDNSKDVALYSIVTFGAPEESSAVTWPGVKNLWETLLTSSHPSARDHYQAQAYVANLTEIVVKGSKASGVGSGRWGAGQTIPHGKLVALFVKRLEKWYIQAIEMNASPQGNRLKPLEP